MDPIQDKDLPELLNTNIYSQRQHLNIMMVSNLSLLAEWAKLCSKVCTRNLQSEAMEPQQRECYRKCGVSLSASYQQCVNKFAKENGYKRY